MIRDIGSEIRVVVVVVVVMFVEGGGRRKAGYVRPAEPHHVMQLGAYSLRERTSRTMAAN